MPHLIAQNWSFTAVRNEFDQRFISTRRRSFDSLLALYSCAYFCVLCPAICCLCSSFESKDDGYRIDRGRCRCQLPIHQLKSACLSELGDPTSSSTYDRVLAVLEFDDRVPYAGKMGYNANGEAIVFNFWKDSKNPKGLWRKTTLDSYKRNNRIGRRS